MKKLRKYLAIVSLFIATPYLVAAKNHYSALSDYYSFTHTVSEITSEEDGENRKYEFTVTNNGKGYVPLTGTFKYRGDDYKANMSATYDEPLFGHSPLVMPNKQFKIIHSTTSSYHNFASGSFSTTAFVDDIGTVTLKGNETISKDESGTRPLYTINCEILNIDYNHDYKYYFAVILDYEGESYCSLCDLNTDGSISFRARDDFDKSKATIKEIKEFYEEVYNGMDYGRLIEGASILLLIIMGVVFIVIPALIATPIIIVKSVKRRKRNKQ